MIFGNTTDPFCCPRIDANFAAGMFGGVKVFNTALHTQTPEDQQDIRLP